jgi:hypothetical protein
LRNNPAIKSSRIPDFVRGYRKGNQKDGSSGSA